MEAQRGPVEARGPLAGVRFSVWAPCVWSPLYLFSLLFLAVARGVSFHKGFPLAVACRLSCSMAGGMLVPRPGIEPTCPALEGGFLTI